MATVVSFNGYTDKVFVRIAVVILREKVATFFKSYFSTLHKNFRHISLSRHSQNAFFNLDHVSKIDHSE